MSNEDSEPDAEDLVLEDGPEVTVSFLVVMTLDGQVVVTGDSPLRGIRTPSRVDIQMMTGYVHDSLVHPPPAPPVDQAEAIRRKLAERKAE
jgi:hypothetical protein